MFAWREGAAEEEGGDETAGGLKQLFLPLQSRARAMVAVGRKGEMCCSIRWMINKMPL